MPGITRSIKKRAEPVGAGRPTGSAVTRVYNGHATLKTAAPRAMALSVSLMPQGASDHTVEAAPCVAASGAQHKSQR
ncbi:hypothetical protein GQ600_22379 [Phytophthora cactorum]|nr:hypothetical protein GQ600_22379 [Phytophthora cactorum]